ncbi:MAG: DUF3999 domain-containing protein [Pseudoxanthomonas sp.]
MKRFAWMALLPLAAFAGVRDDYAQQWPLALSHPDAGAYRVTLDRSVYAQLQSSLVKDVEVVNADGASVAASLFDAEQPLAKTATMVGVPWFPLPFSSTPQSRDIASISEIAADGSLRRVLMADAATASPVVASNEYLIDSSRLHEPVQALQVTWAEGQAPFERPYRVSASDDLKNWRVVQEEAHLVELENNGARVFKDRVELETTQAKYLRLAPLQKNQGPLALIAVRAELAPAPASASWQWEEIAGKRVAEKDGTYSFQFQVQGRFPFERADVVLPGNSSNEWTLQSRDDEEAPWRSISAPWMAFQLEGATSSRSAAQPLSQLDRDRYWRLVSHNEVGDAVPTLRLGYRPEVIVFLAQGQAPYTLVAGSARGKRADAPLPQLVEALRVQRGQDWQPADAVLGPMQALAGAAALTPAPVQRDWKAWLLWALLVGGALVVAGFAFSLLKKPANKP